MKVLHMSTSDIDGGAARAAYRLHQGLQSIGVISQMLVQNKCSNDKTVAAPKTNLSAALARTRITFDALPLKLYPQRQADTFSTQWLPDTVIPRVAQLAPDIINLHWINAGYVKIETIGKLKRPLVWTLHDMWAFTGGCHYNQECDRYTDSCGACPKLSSSRDWDLSRWVWQRKALSWKNSHLTVVALSSWLAKCASSSSLFKELRVELIPNGLDPERYRPINRQIARDLLNLPQDKQLILCGSLNATGGNRKGFHLLLAALKELSKSRGQDRWELIIFGDSQPENSTDLGFKTHYLGTWSDDLSIALIYSAADVFVAPSMQENLANTVMEALACGTPCIAFNIGGMPDMIEHQRNGYLAQPYKIEDLARGITWVIDNEERHQKLSYRAREKVVQEFTQEIQARRYLSLFTEIIDGCDRQKTPFLKSRWQSPANFL
jgi:glycosyltransferase involved in cell wall biosynthesis